MYYDGISKGDGGGGGVGGGGGGGGGGGCRGGLHNYIIFPMKFNDLNK